jgi:phosphodiesterase/alkaline phosphatase D-like protein
MRNWYDRYIQARRNPELREIVRSRGYAHMPDDHEYAINDMVWDITNFQTPAPWVASTADMQMIVDNANAAHVAYNQINPPNNDSGIDTGAFYTRFTAGPHLEVFMITSVCAGNDPSSSNRLVRPATGDMLTALEEAWLLNALATSDRTFKLILSPKMTFEATYGQDSFNSGGREVQRDRLLQAIHDNSPGWKVPGGCFWGSGDFHTPSVHACFAGQDGATFDHLNVTACPAGQDTTGVRNAGAPGTYTRKWFDDGTGAKGSHGYGIHLRNVGIVTVPASGEYAQIEIVLSNGTTWWAGRVYAGENKLTYPSTEFSVA